MVSRDYWRFERTAGAFASLDGLRAIAVLLVVWRHGLFPFFEAHGRAPLLPLGGYDLATIFINGWIGVDLFFVLSGFLIARQLLSLEQRPGGIRYRSYLLKRFLRIMPTYVFVLLMVALGLVPLYQVAPEFLGIRVAYHLLVLQDYLPPNIVVAFWSLGVEEKFYLLAPLILGSAISIREPRARFALVIGAIAVSILLRVWAAIELAATATEPMTYRQFLPVFRYPFHACLDSLGLGMAAALLHRHAMASPDSRLRNHAGAIFWCGVALLMLLVAPRVVMAEIDWWDQTLQPTAIAAGFTMTLLGAAFGGGPQRALGARWMLVVARISYPLYLVHMVVIPLAWAIIGGTPAASAGHLALFLPVYLACAFAASLAIHFAIEKPFLMLKDRLDRLDRRPTPTRVTAQA